MRWVLLAAMIVVWCGVLISTHLPPSRVPRLPYGDVVLHATAYFLMAITSWATYLAFNRNVGLVWLLIIGVMMTVGAVDEWTQASVHRMTDANDWLADMAGTVVAVTVGELAIAPLLDWWHPRHTHEHA